jgi:Na+/serine symporter
MGPVLLAFATRSSEVAIPSHIEQLERMGVPKRIIAVVLPLSYSFNLDGSALYLGAAVTFLADAYGLHLTASTLGTVLLTALIASKGVAKCPSIEPGSARDRPDCSGTAGRGNCDRGRRRCPIRHGTRWAQRVR